MPPVFAYIDPGSGSIIIQVVIGALVAIPFFLRTQIGRGMQAVRRAVGRDDATTGDGVKRPEA